MANSEDPDWTAPIGGLICVCIVCQKLSINFLTYH